MIITKETKQAIYSTECKTVFCNVLILQHPDFEKDLRFIDNTEDIGLYSARGFDFTPPAHGSVDEASTISIDDVDRTLANVFQEIGSEAVTAQVGLIDTENPETLIDGPYRYKVVSFSKSSSDGKATLSLQRLAILDCQASAKTYSATVYPGLIG